MYALYNCIRPRQDYKFIHAELYPNHVLVDKNLNVYLIDIEGAMFSDAEYEHSFLEFRFEHCYKYLETNTLDKDRMNFYKLYHHIGYLSGALELLQTDYSDMDDVNGMIRYNFSQVIAIYSTKAPFD